ncbi:MAG: Gfo/Idh/MocA family oxidoreductase [Mariprofundales bacterium]
MNIEPQKLRVAVLGGNGIGRVHVRIYHELGVDVVAVLCSTDQSAKLVAEGVFAALGIKVKAFSNIQDIFSESIDAVSICTSPAVHISHIMAAFDSNLPVFCEKPLFWSNNLTSDIVNQEIENLGNHVNRKLFVNTSNTVFLDSVYERLPNTKDVKKFSFQFYTNGLFHGKDIAIDLLPHGLSMLLHIFAEREISSFSWCSEYSCFNCSFLYGDCYVEFDFQENPEGEKKLCFALNEQKFQRLQEGRGESYKVFLQDEKTGEKIHSPDPFKVYISKFITYCTLNDEHIADEFHTAAINMKLMAQCLEIINANNTIDKE